METIKYSKFRIILFISVCNLTLPYITLNLTLRLPYVLPYLTVPYHTLPYALPYLTVPYHNLLLTLPYVLPYLTSYLILP